MDRGNFRRGGGNGGGGRGQGRGVVVVSMNRDKAVVVVVNLNRDKGRGGYYKQGRGRGGRGGTQMGTYNNQSSTFQGPVPQHKQRGNQQPRGSGRDQGQGRGASFNQPGQQNPGRGGGWVPRGGGVNAWGRPLRSAKHNVLRLKTPQLSLISFT